MRLSTPKLCTALLIGSLAFVALPGAPLAAKPGGKESKPKRHRVDLTGATKMVGGSIIPGPVIDRGTVEGKPFGDGKIKLTIGLNLVESTATGTFRIRSDRGTAFGEVDMTFVIEGGEITFTGTADLTGGKGKFKGIEGEDLKAYDHNTLDGQNGTITLKGFATY